MTETATCYECHTATVARPGLACPACTAKWAARVAVPDNQIDGCPAEWFITNSCPACGGEGVELGKLGALTHFRCRSCGADFSQETP